MKHLLLFFLMAFVALTSCSDDKNNEPDSPPGSNYSTSVVMKLNLGEEATGKLLGVRILQPVAADSIAAVDTVYCSNNFDKTLTFKLNGAQLVGMKVSPIFKEEPAKGDVIKYMYTMSCHVYLLDGERVVDMKFMEDIKPVNIKVSDDETDLVEKYSKYYLFNVNKEGVSYYNQKI